MWLPSLVGADVEIHPEPLLKVIRDSAEMYVFSILQGFLNECGNLLKGPQKGFTKDVKKPVKGFQTAFNF